MTIFIAQTKAIKGDIASNLEDHKNFIFRAIERQADLIVFPELSLTGYEPTLADELKMELDDHRLDELQNISNNHTISIAVGIPLKNNGGVSIGLALFQPHQPRTVYFKQHLHDDELPFFVAGDNLENIHINNTPIALAICYEISVGTHARKAAANGNRIYIASVAKALHNIDKALSQLRDIAQRHHMTVLMSNFVGECDGLTCAGKSSAWNSKGDLVAQLDEHTDGWIIFDTMTNTAIQSSLHFK